jgi:hypothetical protein
VRGEPNDADLEQVIPGQNLDGGLPLHPGADISSWSRCSYALSDRVHELIGWILTWVLVFRRTGLTANGAHGFMVAGSSTRAEFHSREYADPLRLARLRNRLGGLPLACRSTAPDIPALEAISFPRLSARSSRNREARLAGVRHVLCLGRPRYTSGRTRKTGVRVTSHRIIRF